MHFFPKKYNLLRLDTLSPKALTAIILLNSPPVSIIAVCFCHSLPVLDVPVSKSNFFTSFPITSIFIYLID